MLKVKRDFDALSKAKNGINNVNDLKKHAN